MLVTVCVRAGCGGETAALASFDRENLVVRLRNVDSDPAFTIGLCEIHVGRLTVPIGWTLAEERSDAPEEGSSLPTPRGERVDTSDETSTPRRPSSPEGGLLNRAFQGPDSDSQTKRRQSWLEGNPDSSSQNSSSDNSSTDNSSSDNSAPAKDAGTSSTSTSGQDVPPAESASASISTPPLSSPPPAVAAVAPIPSMPAQVAPRLLGMTQSGLPLGQARGFLPPN